MILTACLQSQAMAVVDYRKYREWLCDLQITVQYRATTLHVHTHTQGNGREEELFYSSAPTPELRWPISHAKRVGTKGWSLSDAHRFLDMRRLSSDPVWVILGFPHSTCAGAGERVVRVHEFLRPNSMQSCLYLRPVPLSQNAINVGEFLYTTDINRLQCSSYLMTSHAGGLHTARCWSKLWEWKRRWLMTSALQALTRCFYVSLDIKLGSASGGTMCCHPPAYNRMHTEEGKDRRVRTNKICHGWWTEGEETHLVGFVSPLPHK